MIRYEVIFVLLVFVSSVSQVMLKKAAQREYTSVLRSYLNPLVIVAYLLFFGVTLGVVYCYKYIPVSYGAVLEAVGYVFVTFWGVALFKEKMGWRKVIALCLIIVGIVIFTA